MFLILFWSHCQTHLCLNCLPNLTTSVAGASPQHFWHFKTRLCETFLFIESSITHILSIMLVTSSDTHVLSLIFDHLARQVFLPHNFWHLMSHVSGVLFRHFFRQVSRIKVTSSVTTVLSLILVTSPAWPFLRVILVTSWATLNLESYYDIFLDKWVSFGHLIRNAFRECYFGHLMRHAYLES